MFIFTKDIEAKNFKALAGMPVPSRYNYHSSRKAICEKYGKDAIVEITSKNFDEFRHILSVATADEKESEKVKQLSALCSEQAKQIEALEKDNLRLAEENKKLKDRRAAQAEKGSQQVGAPPAE